MSDVQLQVKNLDEVMTALRGLPDKLRKGVLRNALAAGARIVRDDAKRRAPVLRPGDPAQAAGRRKPGTVRDAIRVRTSKRDRRAGNVGVFVNVRPLTKTQIRRFRNSTGRMGKDNPDDPFYWQWLEFGRTARPAAQGGARRLRRAVGAIAPMRFLQNASTRLGDALRKIEQVLGPQIQRMNNKLRSGPQ